jgi:transcriptional regulator with XRE-family HTH domain
MRMSTIYKHRFGGGGGSAFAEALGAEIRTRRMARGLSQEELAHPFSRAFVSSVENGHLVPSLASLLMIAARLNSSAGAILEAVEDQMEGRLK